MGLKFLAELGFRQSIAAVIPPALVRSSDCSFGGIRSVHQDVAFIVFEFVFHEQPACHLNGRVCLTELVRIVPGQSDCTRFWNGFLRYPCRPSSSA
jgi:hypothetical protein